MSETTTTTETPSTPAADPIAAAAGAVTETPKTDATVTESDPRHALLIELGREKESKRGLEKKLQEALADVGPTKKFRDAVAAGDFIASLEALGIDPDDYYMKASDQIAARVRAAQDPAQIARATVKEELTAHETKRQTEARAAEVKAWTDFAQTTLEASFAEFPDVGRGLAAGRFTWDDVVKVAYTLVEKGQDSTPKAVLRAIQDQIKPAAAPAKAEGTGGAAGAPPSTLNSDAPSHKAEEDDGLSFEEALAKAKAKFLK